MCPRLKRKHKKKSRSIKRRRTSDHLLSRSESRSRHTRSTICENYGCIQIRNKLEALEKENEGLKEKNTQLENDLKTIKNEMDNSLESEMSQRFSQVRIKGSQTMILDSDENKLFKREQHGARVTYSIHMILLGLALLILNNCPANQIPAILAIIFNSAGFTSPRLPKYNFFRKLRFMLKPLNDHLILLFMSEAIDLSLAFDETTYSTRMGSIIGITMTNENGNSILIGLLEHEKRSLTRGEKSSFDAEVIIDHLKNICGDKFDTIVKKITTVLTDNCSTAVSGSRKLAQSLDDICPLASSRRTLRCTVHLCALLEKHALNRLPLLTNFAKKVSFHLVKPAGQSKDNLFDLWCRKSHRRFQHSHGERFFFHTNNLMVSFLDFNKLFSFARENSSNSNGAKEIQLLMSNKELKPQLLVLAGLGPLIRDLWKKLTVKRTKQALAAEIEQLKETVNGLRSNDIDIIHLIEAAKIDDKDALEGRNVFLTTTDEATTAKVKDIYLIIVGQMTPFLNEFMVVEEGTENHKIDPSNVPVERSFGIFKYLEKLLVNLQFGLIAQTAIAKFNHLHATLDSFETSVILDAHADINTLEASMKAMHIEQENFRVQHAESMRDEVFVILRIYFP